MEEILGFVTTSSMGKALASWGGFAAAVMLAVEAVTTGERLKPYRRRISFVVGPVLALICYFVGLQDLGYVASFGLHDPDAFASQVPYYHACQYVGAALLGLLSTLAARGLHDLGIVGGIKGMLAMARPKASQP